MNKPVVKNWMRYWAGTLAISGMLVVGACSTSQDRTSADNTTTTDGENVGMTDDNTGSETATSDMGTTDTDTYGTTDTQDTDVAVTTETETDLDGTTETDTDIAVNTDTENTEVGVETETTSNTDYSTSQAGTVDNTSATVSDQDNASATTTTQGYASRTAGTPQSSTYGGNTQIDKHIEKHADVNEAIEESLSELSGTSELAMQQSNASQDMARENEQTGVTYDRMSNTSADDADQTDMSTDNMNDAQTGTTNDTMVNTDQEGTATYDQMNNTDQAGIVEDNTRDTEAYDEMSTSGVDRGVDAQNTTTEDLSGIDENGAPLGGIKEDNNDRTDAATEQSDVTTDRMSNTNMEESESYMGVYDSYEDPAMELSNEERQMLEENRANIDQRRQTMEGQMDEQLQAYYFPAVEARPDVNYSELVEEIKEEMRLPKELEDAKMKGTMLLQFVVDEEGEVSSAEVIDGVITQVKEDGTTMSFMRLTDKAKEGVVDEVENEDLLEFSDEQKEQLKQIVSQESLRVLQSREGNWQPATQDEKPVKMIVVLPLRFDVED